MSMLSSILRGSALVLASISASAPASATTAILPDGRAVTPVGFTIPVESFATAEALSPDGRFIAVLSPTRGRSTSSISVANPGSPTA